MQEFQRLKLERFLNEENAQAIPNPGRIKDIERALHRVVENIKMWEGKLAAFEQLPPYQPKSEG